MGKLNASLLRYLTKEDIALLQGVEIGMKNHELVSGPLVVSLAKLQNAGSANMLRQLCKQRLLQYEKSKKCAGYRLTNLGYDYLALEELTKRKVIYSFGNQIGVGKESNIYTVATEEQEELCLKLHRLGRVCFRKVTEKRDYHKHAKALSWLYLSKISATKEFAYMKALYDEGFPVPKPVSFNRHCVVMELIKGTLLNHILELEDPEKLYDSLMDLIVRFGNCGLIHGDFNEFNIMVKEDETPVIIDFPQMLSTEHADAEMYFNRDVECIKTFFRRRFRYESELYPKFEDLDRTSCLDATVHCTGFTKDMAKRLNIELGLDSESDNENEQSEEEDGEEIENEKDQDKLKKEQIVNKTNKEHRIVSIDSANHRKLIAIEAWIEQDQEQRIENNNETNHSNGSDAESWIDKDHRIVSSDEGNQRSETDVEAWNNFPDIEKDLSALNLSDSDERDELSSIGGFSNFDGLSVASTIKEPEEARRTLKNQLRNRRVKRHQRRCQYEGKAQIVNAGRRAVDDKKRQQIKCLDF